MMLGLKYTHKSKKAPVNPLKLNADRESAIHERSIPYLLKNAYNVHRIYNIYLQGVYK